MMAPCLLAIALIGVHLPDFGASVDELLGDGFRNQHWDATDSKVFAKLTIQRKRGSCD